MSCDQEDQDDEILAVREICGEDFQEIPQDELETVAKSIQGLSTAEPCQFRSGGRIRVSLDLSDRELSVKYYLPEDPLKRPFEFAIKHLLPLRLTFLLPSNYPSEKSPTLSLECPWITTKQTK